MIDIYNKLPTDQNWKPRLETEDEIEQILSQVKMVLGTEKGDVLGDYYFGLNLKKYIFSMGYNKEELETLITSSILENIAYDTSKYSVKITVDFGHDVTNASDYAVLTVVIDGSKYMGIMINQ